MGPMNAVGRTGWAWELLDADDRRVEAPVSPVFTNRFDAESWLGETWRDLAREGVAAARLRFRDEEVAPPLPLHRP